MIIKDEKLQKAIMRALLDEHSRSIISSTIWKAKSVRELMREHGIPMASAYRRVKELVDCNLLEVERAVLTDDGKKYDLYRSRVKNIDIRFKEGLVEVKVVPTTTAADRLMRPLGTR